MINNKLILSFAVSVLSMVGYTAQANPVDIRKATDIARQYMRQPVAVPTPGTSTISTRSVAEDPAYHLFVSKEEQRFVIVSGESQMNEVVGYGKLSTGDANALPPQVHALLQQYTETVRQVRSGQQPAASLPKSLKRYVTPLVTAQWGQSYPYNSKTPVIDGKPTYTGCVATAAAQFLYFYKWPKQRPSLYINPQGDEADASPTYLWDAIKDTRQEMTNQRSVSAVGRLMKDVARAIRITFGTQASPSNIEYTLDALQNNFGYTTRLLHRDRMQADEFREAIMQELSDGYPVMVCGGIHAFIYDGYDRRGFIHANFGWDGQGDGYYDINTITTPLPGPFMGNGQFWENQVVLMAHPKNGQYPDFPTPQRTLGARKNAAFEISPRTGDANTRFNATISSGSYHRMNGEFYRFTGQVGIAVMDKKGNTVKLINSNNRNFEWTTIFMTQNIPIGDIHFADIPQGDYLLVPVSRELVAKNPDKYEAWYPIEYANRMKLAVTSSGISVTDEIQGGALTVCRAPEMLFPAYAGVGDPAMITFGVRNPNVDEVHGNLRMTFEPVNGGAKFVAPFTNNSIVSFRRLADTQVAVNFPTNYSDNSGPHAMAPGRYNVKLVLETTNTKTKQFIPLGADQNFQIDVLPYPEVKIMVHNVDYLVNGNEVNQQVFDVTKQREIGMRIHTEIRGNNQRYYYSKIYYRLVCPEANESIEAGQSGNVTLRPFQRTEPRSTVAKIDLTRLTPGRRYEVHVEIDENGKRREIWTNDSPRAQIMVVNGKSNSTPDNPTKPVVPPTPEQPSQPETPKATQVVLDATQREVKVDDLFTLVANVLPKEADQKVTWHLSQPGILDMVGNGQFKALKAGEVTITATAQDGSGMKATCRVVVKNPMATQVVLNKTQHNAIVDDVFTLTAQVMPEKAAQNVVWTMDKTNILQDLGEGKFKALKAGEVTITVTAQDGSGMKATCRVVVKNPIATQVVLNETQHHATVDDVFTLTAQVMPEKAVQNVVWTMDKTDILQDLGEGKFKALKAGEVTITATAQDGSGMKATCRVVVKNPMATQVVLNETQHHATVDDVFTLTAQVMPEKAAQNVVWTMDKTDILQDLGNGKFKALKAGEVTITATAQDGSGMKATCHVVVKNPMATRVVLNASNKFVYVEEIFTLNANILPEKAVQKVNWELSNATIVESLGDGRFLALREGRTTITAVATDGSGVRAVCHVVVQAKKPVVPEIPKATEVVLDSLQRTVHAEEEFTLIAKVMPEKAIQKVVWTMDKTDILQDLGEGKFKALKTGEVTITATAQDGSGMKATCHVTVIPPTTLDLKKTDVRHSLHWEGATLVLRGAKPGSIVRVYSMKGKKLHQLVTTDSEVRIDFGLWHGVYLLETNDGFRRKVVR